MPRLGELREARCGAALPFSVASVFGGSFDSLPPDPSIRPSPRTFKTRPVWLAIIGADGSACRPHPPQAHVPGDIGGQGGGELPGRAHGPPARLEAMR
jgi:hypothetical protein